MMASMSGHLAAEDLLPLAKKLTRAERLRLMAMLRQVDEAEAGTAARRPSEVPSGASGEFEVDVTGLVWDAEGWEELAATR
jgi:hypothetical protein